METSNSEILKEEREDTRARVAKIVEIGKPIISQTALVQDRDFTEEDVEKIKQFFREAKPFVHQKVFPEYWTHLDLARKYASLLSREINKSGHQINSCELQSLALIHDIGRLVSPHRYFRTTLVGDSIIKKLSLREEIKGKMVPELEIYGLKPSVDSTDQLSLEQKILFLSDAFGRLVNGKPAKLSDLNQLDDEHTERYQHDSVFTSERLGKARFDRVHELDRRFLSHLKEEFIQKYGIDTDQISKELENMEEKN